MPNYWNENSNRWGAWDTAYLIYVYGTGMGTIEDIAMMFGSTFGAINSKIYRLRKNNPDLNKVLRRYNAK